MRDSVFKLLSSLRLVQEQSESSRRRGSGLDIEVATLNPATLGDQRPLNQDLPSSPSQQESATPIPAVAHLSASKPHAEHSKPSPGAKTTSLTPARKRLKSGRRYSRARQSSLNLHLHHFSGADESNSETKLRSRKLLCLWPLPATTRYYILLAVVVSTLNSIGWMEVKCSAPTYVLYQFQLLDLLLSPLLFRFTLQGILLFAWNVLILGLIEESLVNLLRSTRRFVQVLASIVVSVSVLRQGIGYLFSKSTGYAVPALFFSDSVHECNEGIAPFLFALLLVQSLCIDDKYILFFDDEITDRVPAVRKVTLQLLMVMVNYLSKNILWWSLTSLLAGSLTAMIIQYILTTENKQEVEMLKDEHDLIALAKYPNLPLSRRMWSAFKNITMVVSITLLLLLMFNAYHMHEIPVDPSALNQVSSDPYMLTMIVMTAPRRGDPSYLTRTLDSYMANWPLDPEPGSLYSRIQTIVYTHFTNHVEFDNAKDKLSNDPKSKHYLKWVREEGEIFNQRLHVAKALSLATDTYKSTYIGLMEDDFPICGSTEWHELENVIYKANQYVPNHCGVFVGTGGSGLFLKSHIAKLVSNLLLIYTDIPPDIIVQKCLRGDLPECQQCSQTLVTSKRLLMYHIGYNTSTSDDRSYKNNEFQCGWRHPFNSDPNVITL